MSAASQCFQFDTILDELSELGSNSIDPAEMLSRSFASCLQIPSVLSAAYWHRRHDGSWEIIESYDSCQDVSLSEFPGQLCSSLEKAYVTKKVNRFSIHLGTRNAKMVLMPVLGGECVKAVFAFWMHDDAASQLSQSKFKWSQLGNQISASLENVILRARAERKQKNVDWSKHLVRSFEKLDSQLNDLNAAPVPYAGANTKCDASTIEQEAPAIGILKSLDSMSVSVATVSPCPLDSGRPFQAMRDQSSRLVQLAKIVGRKLDEKSVAYDVVNELRAYFGFGRISLAYVRGGKCKIAAISGVESFDTRSGVVVSLRALCQQIAKSKTAVWHPEEAEQLPNHFLQFITRYYEKTDAKSVALLPVFETPEISSDPEDLAAVLQCPDENRGRLVAIVCIEGIRESISKKDASELWNSVEPIIRNAVTNACFHSGIFLYPVWKSLGDLQRLYRERHRTKAVLATIGSVVAVALLCFFPSELKLKSEGLIQPTNRSRIYAEVAATVDQILVVEGRRVLSGEPLVKLLSPELDIEYERIRGEWSESKQSLVSIRDSLNGYQVLDENTSRQLRKERSSLEEKTRSLERQKELLEQKRSKLTVISPRDGQVITWDVPQRLGGRPVEPGQHLMTVAEETGPWELELRLPDPQTGYLRKAMQNCPSNDPLLVEFVLASNPGAVHTGRLRRIADANTFDEDEGSVLRVYVDIDESTRQELGSLKSGTEVIAHIRAGQCSLGFGLFFGFFDWVNRQRFKYLW